MQFNLLMKRVKNWFLGHRFYLSCLPVWKCPLQVDCHAFRGILFLLAGGLSFAVLSTSAEEHLIGEECDVFSQAEMRDCLTKQADKSQEALQKIEQQVISSLLNWDENETYIRQASSKFAASQMDYVRYREAHCAFAASLGGGAIGHALELRRLACFIELNHRRVDQLSNFVASLPQR